MSNVTVINVGRRGPPGAPGVARQLETPFHHGDATPKALGSVSGTVHAVSLVIVRPFNGAAPQLEVRAGSQVLLGAGQNLPGEIGRYESSPAVNLATATAVTLHLTPGAGSTDGAGFVYLEMSNGTLD